MIKILSSSLKTGNRYSSPIYFDDGKNMFLAARKLIKKSDLQVLGEWNIDSLLTDGHLLSDDEIMKMESQGDDLEELEELDELEDLDDLAQIPELSCPTHHFPVDYMFAIKTVESIWAAYKGQRSIDKKLIDDAAQRLLDFVAKDATGAVKNVIGENPDAENFAIDAVDTAIISCVMSLELALSKKAIVSVIIAAFLHDIGMQTVPLDIINKKGKLTREEFEQLKMHPVKSARYVSNNLLYSREIATIVQQHHERWDGNGYPEGKKAQDIILPARIISVADAFGAMIAEKPYRNSMIAYEAVKNLLGDKQKRFDPSVLKIFIKAVGVYPAGSYVLLNDSSVAIVSKTISDAPFMPTVRLLNPNKKQSVFSDGDEIELRGQKNLYIVRALDPEELNNAIAG